MPEMKVGIKIAPSYFNLFYVVHILKIMKKWKDCYFGNGNVARTCSVFSFL